MARILPSAKRSCNAPSSLKPAYRPCSCSPVGKFTAIAVPTICASFCQLDAIADIPPRRQRSSQMAKASASISTTACGCGGNAPRVFKSVTGRSSPGGCQTRFKPMPTTIASSIRSSNIPHSFAPSLDSRSFGHFICTAISGAIWAMLSCTASADTNASVDAGGSSGRRRTIVLANMLPSGLSHVRPIRPRPPS